MLKHYLFSYMPYRTKKKAKNAFVDKKPVCELPDGELGIGIFDLTQHGNCEECIDKMHRMGLMKRYRS